MLFQHINRHADKHRKRVYLVLVAVIGLSFVVFVTPRGCDDMGSQDGRRIGAMFGRKVTVGQFRRALRDADVASVIQTGRRLGDLQGMTEAGVRVVALRRMQALHEVRKLGLDPVSRDEFVEYVKTRPIFRKDGAYDKQSLDNARNYIVNQIGVTGADFDRVLRENIAIGRLESRAVGGIVVSPEEARESFLRNQEKFGLSYAEAKIDTAKEGDPSEADLQAYFDANRDVLLLPIRKALRVVSFPFPEKVDEKSISEERLRQEYEKNKKSVVYKDKSFEDVRPDILKRLLAGEPRFQAVEKAKALLARLAVRPEGESLEALAERAAALAKEQGGTVQDTEPFAEDAKTLPGFPTLTALIGKSRQMTDAKPLIDQHLLAGKVAHVAVLLKTVPGEKAEKLEDVRETVVKAVLAEKARALFAEKALPHAKALEGLAELDIHEFANEKALDDKDATTEQREATYDAARTLAMRYLRPAFKREERTAWFVQFPNGNFTKEAGELVDDAQIEEYYHGKPAEYKEREEMRVSQILVNLARDASEEAEQAARKRAEGILERIRAGEPFEEIAKKESDDSATKAKGGDLGFKERSKHYGLAEALEGLGKGELSEITKTYRGLAILKVTDIRKGLELKDAAADIRQKLTTAKAAELAKKRATELADALIAGFDSARGRLAEGAPDAESYALARQVFERVAAEHGVEIRKITAPFPPGSIPGVSGGGYDLATSIHKLSPRSPFTDPVSSRNTQFVGMLDGIVPGRLYDPETEGDIVEERYAEVVRTDNARAAAKAKAEAIRAACVAPGDAEQTANGDTKLAPFPPFVRADLSPFESEDWQMQRLAYEQFRDLPQIREIMKTIDKTKAAPGTVLELIEGERSYTVVRLDSRTRPEESEFDEAARKQYTASLRQAKAAAAIGALYQQIARESKTTLFGEDYSAGAR